ncbi:MAG: hypothetical protein U9O96_00595 [Candidatus Thermoplasmatota archaeon]|nr:hypothetical protein [Candidatus Thermoplasmatota archaeon]
MEEKEAKGAYEKFEDAPPAVSYELTMNKIAVDENRVDCPLLFIAVKDDKISSPGIVKKMAEKYDSEYNVYEGCHYIFHDWQGIADGIERFVVNDA